MERRIKQIVVHASIVSSLFSRRQNYSVVDPVEDLKIIHALYHVIEDEVVFTVWSKTFDVVPVGHAIPRLDVVVKEGD